MIYKYYGPPGTGKTFKLISRSKAYARLGTPLHKIGYFAFSKKAAGVAKERMPASDKNLPYFQTEIKESDTTVFFSLLFSYLENIDLSFDDYSVIYSEDKIYARPSLVFEKVDVDDSLFMRVGQSLPELSASVLDQFDLFKYAEINELEKQITVKYIEQDPLEEVTQLVSKLYF